MTMDIIEGDSMDNELLPMWAIDEIWEQWKQSNELCGSTNFPLSVSTENCANANLTKVFDAEFKCLYEVPSHLIVHMPSARLNITRLVACRNYKSYEPSSCTMGSGCKFVHADVDYNTLETHPIHVNYIWRHESECTYERLPAGEVLEVLSADMTTVNLIPSEQVLNTRGACARHDIAEPLIRCKYFETNQTCFTGERCNFIHVVCVDPNAQGAFKRAPKVVAEPNASACISPQHSNNIKGKKSVVGNNGSGFNKEEHSAGMRKAPEEGRHDGGSGWVPNVSSPSFEPSPVVQMALRQGLNGTCGLPQKASQKPTSGPRSPSATTPPMGDTNTQEILAALRTAGVCGTGYASATTGRTVPQDQMNTLLSQLVSIMAQQAATPRTITVAPSPQLDDPAAVGTLLFLPRGAAEAVAVQPVFDGSFLSTVVTLGAGQRRCTGTIQQPRPQPLGDVWQLYNSQIPGHDGTVPLNWPYAR
ncbi:hypothetical protein, conserved [Trypanosoma brucei gambiense DAL972]|uniref:C3H1-type domain-containing protein n=2 Tax=Trypanosoma brucei TaxID=5691 RepID=D0A594_TRYB9|nr:hypothetical protein, conserved [Trypanosoma brucei gambiense DAL972]RHW69921.1 Zinc finger CCCH domain-containing protein 35 [Trypanosoma brucei equiperdum]CBH16438.1 hypothetical protein, conserved [Trypanosoma brucei gambiense DAL972]|eukprot:XP_011778702.1 hypothetical protein, conserved [Trypanosoma brucei gambiense DAL972]